MFFAALGVVTVFEVPSFGARSGVKSHGLERAGRVVGGGNGGLVRRFAGCVAGDFGERGGNGRAHPVPATDGGAVGRDEKRVTETRVTSEG